MENITRIGISIPPKLLDRFDGMTREMGYANRSEAIRDAVREYILKNEMRGEEGDRVGIISLIYDHDVRGVNDTLIDLQHQYHDIIQSTIHQHLDAHKCMELIIALGDVKKIKEIKDRLTAISGVRHSELIIMGSTEY